MKLVGLNIASDLSFATCGSNGGFYTYSDFIKMLSA